MTVSSLQHSGVRPHIRPPQLPRQVPAPLLCGGAQGCHPAQAWRRLAVVLHSKRNQERDFNVDEFVSFDEEDEWESQGKRVTPSAKPFISQLFAALGMVVDRLTDLAFAFVPQGVSVGVVRTAVSGALILLVLSFAKSILGFLLTLGSLVLGAYIATRILGIDLSGMGVGEPEEFKEAAAKKRRGAPSKRDPRGRQSEFQGLLGGSKEDEDGLLDVWFERNKDKYRRTK